MAYIDDHQARFIKAFGSDAALDSPDPSETSASPTPSSTAPLDRADTSMTAAAPIAQKSNERLPGPGKPAMSVSSTSPATPSADESSAPPPQESDATIMVGADATQLISPGEASAAARIQPSDETSDGRTIMVPLAALLAEGGVLAKTEYQLGAVNYLGRAEENQVQITSPGVSRKHAVIMVASGGFELKDLGSQNGVVVNGQRVTERQLAEGDRIEIGGVSLVFRSPWPIRSAKSAPGASTAKPGARN
jgi:hypothetical protein